MPIIEESSYPGPPRYMFNGHLETVLPLVLQKKFVVSYDRERFTLSDGDFLFLDWMEKGSKDLIVLSHGVVGDANREYIKRSAVFFYQRGWDILAWNCRSCGGEMNRKLRMYHHGEIEDIHEVILHALASKNYKTITLIGFSMGGAITLKYLGVHGKDLPPAVRMGIAFCTPFDIEMCSAMLDRRENYFYRHFFRKSLIEKFRRKAEQFPDHIDLSLLEGIERWKDIDERFSAPINGFESADDFYYHASANNFIEGVQRPALLVNTLNDPIITPACIPRNICATHPHLFLETPHKGGHVGFTLKQDIYSWMEYRSLQFMNDHRW